MTAGNDGAFDVPFETHDGGPLDTSRGLLIASGLVVLATTVEAPAYDTDGHPTGGPVETRPALVFRFLIADSGDFATPVLLMLDEGQVSRLTGMIGQACEAAAKAASA